MKGVPGLILAGVLGLAGAVLSWWYLERLAGREARVAFIGIHSGATLNAGEAITDAHIVRIDLPRSAAGNLEQAAPLWEFRSTVIGQSTNRSYRGGEIVLHQDLRTIAQRDLNDKLAPDEVAMWIPVDSRTFNASRVNPDDEVSFLIGSSDSAPVETLVPIPETQEVPTPPPPGGAQIIGPFRILEIGNRAGRSEVYKAAGARGGNESSITIVARLVGGRLDPNSERLSAAIRTSGRAGLGVILHSKRKK